MKNVNGVQTCLFTDVTMALLTNPKLNPNPKVINVSKLTTKPIRTQRPHTDKPKH